MQTSPVIWLRPIAAVAPLAAQPCECPCLTGPQAQLARVLRALNDAVVAPVCRQARALAESAFQTLRRLLPDTDVYVWHRR
jgi:hypothetical protein